MSGNPPVGPKLHAADGAPAPPGLAGDLTRAGEMPPEAIAHLWQALGPVLADGGSESTERTLDVFSSAYRVDQGELATALKACRFLIDGAARLDVPPEKLAEDIDALAPDAHQLKTVLLAGYEDAKPELRRAIVTNALADHGKLLLGARYRLDIVDSSDRGARIGMPVVMLTLHYREGNEERRITLQALPDTVGQLHEICARVLR
ncbi:MAG: hypothetical protein R3B70_06985 [Polyangiaceae bacterium]